MPLGRGGLRPLLARLPEVSFPHTGNQAPTLILFNNKVHRDTHFASI